MFCSQNKSTCVHSFITRFGASHSIFYWKICMHYLFIVQWIFWEFHKLVDLINIKGNKLFWNVKIQWISMLFLTKMYFEYHLLIVKMHVEFTKKWGCFKKLDSLCDVELIQRSHCILPLFKCVHILIKFAQGRDVFICNFVDIIKLVHQRLFKLYYDIFINYEDPTFDDFNSLFILSNDTFPMNWFSNFNGGKEERYLAFKMVLSVLNMSPNILSTRLPPKWMMSVKRVIWHLVVELEWCF